MKYQYELILKVLKCTCSVMLATSYLLTSHIWLVATVLDSAETECICHLWKFY